MFAMWSGNYMQSVALRAIFTLLILVFASACHQTEGQRFEIESLSCSQIESENLGDGKHYIDVVHLNGEVDRVGIHVASPPGEGPFPVVIYAPGAGQKNFANCSPDRIVGAPPGLSGLLELGYLVIKINHRNSGSFAPKVGEVRPRDHYLRDSRLILTAAEWARTKHGKGSDQIALIGSSFGTWNVFWAALNDFGQSDLQQCLNIKTVVMVGESAYHPANDKKVSEAWLPGNLESRILSVLSAYVLSLYGIARDLNLYSIKNSDLYTGILAERMSEHFTDESRDLIAEVLFKGIDPSIPSCSGLSGDVPPMCDPDCLADTGSKYFIDKGLDIKLAFDIGNIDFWLKPTAQEYFTFWDPPQFQIPTLEVRENNELLQIAYQTSPVTGYQGNFISNRVLHLLSENDAHYRVESAAMLFDSLSSLNVPVIRQPTVSVDAVGQPCEHGEYLDPLRPKCGFEIIVNELEEAFKFHRP